MRNALYPNLQPYLALLQKEMQRAGNEMKQYEAYKCLGALLHAAGMAIRNHVKQALLCLLVIVKHCSDPTPTCSCVIHLHTQLTPFMCIDEFSPDYHAAEQLQVIPLKSGFMSHLCISQPMSNSRRNRLSQKT